MKSKLSDRPIVEVVADTQLWSSEYDAGRQKTIQPGPGIPIALLRARDKIEIDRVEQGKDYVAAEVQTQTGARGWILLYGQDGIKVVKP